jgi:hypothetical protein
MENIKRIQEGLREGHYANTPHQSAEDLAILAGEYAYVMGQWELILQRKPAIWNGMRLQFKSDTACERAWEQTADGMQEASFRLRAKAIEKMMSALKSLIRIAEGESRNQM